MNDFFSAPAAEALLAELGAAVTPLTGAELRKRGASRGVKPKAAAEALASLVSAGRVHAWSGNRYALEPESAFVERQILAALADGPQTAADLGKRLAPAGIKRAAKARDDLVSAGRVHVWSGKRYALEPESAVVERQILAALADGPQTAAALAARLASAGIQPAALKKALPTFAAAGKLYLAGAGKRQLISRQPLPALAKILVEAATHLPITRKELAARAVEQLPWHTPAQANKEITYLLGTGALRQHKAAKLLFAPPDDAEAFLRRVAEQAYQRAMAEWSKVLGVAAPQQPSRVDDLILDAILRIEPQKGMLVTMRQLRRSKWLSGVSKEEFDQAIFRLAKDRKIFISPHPSPAYLSAEEREWLPRDEDGVYYGGLCWRD